MRLKTAPVLILLTGLLAAAAWPRPEENLDQLSEAEAMGMMRTINTLEVSISAYYERGFLSLADLASQYHEQSHEQWLSTVVLKDNNTGTLKNYQLSVIVSPDRQHFVTEMIPSKDCDLALFSNESGIIYMAKGLGCDEKAPNKEPGDPHSQNR